MRDTDFITTAFQNNQISLVMAGKNVTGRIDVSYPVEI